MQRVKLLLTIFMLCSAMQYALAGHDIYKSEDFALSDSVATELQRDSIKERLDSIEFSEMPWYEQVVKSGFHIHDPRINYPRFPRFLLNVYDWGDRTFNSYDTDYVVGTGKNWKARLENYNWMESYMLIFAPHTRDMLHIRSEIYSDLGAYLSFMAVSIGYTAKVNNWIKGSTPTSRTNFNFDFTCSRFSARIGWQSTEGNTRITHFGDYDAGKSFSYDFNDIKHKSKAGEIYYFFNHRRYSQAAAYSFSKYQLKSAGTPILGFAFTHQRITMDFSTLPEDMKVYLPTLDNDYKFRFTDYALVAGYAYNWAIRPRKWLFNITAIPSLGYRHSYSDSSEGNKSMMASNLRMRFSLVYNHKALFASLMGKFDGNLYFNSKYVFFNSTESLSLIVGARF